LKEILSEKNEWADKHANELLQLLGKQLIQNKKDLVTASRATLEKCRVQGEDLPGIIIDLLQKGLFSLLVICVSANSAYNSSCFAPNTNLVSTEAQAMR